MKGLILDTSGDTALIAISDHGRLVHHVLFPSQHSSSLLTMEIQKALSEASIAMHQLNYIGIGIGPGSFLGTRIGVTIAKSLAYGLQIPLVSFCSLQAYQPPCSAQFSVMIDAKSKGVYLLNGHKTSETVIYEPTPVLVSIEEFLSCYESTHLYITPNKSALAHKLPVLKDALLEVSPSLSYLCRYCVEKSPSSHINALDPISIHYLRLC